MLTLIGETTIRRGRNAVAAAVAALAFAGVAGSAQDDDSGPVSEITPANGTAAQSANPGGLPGDFFRSDPALGMRYREFFRDTRSPFRSSGQPEIDAPLTVSADAGLRYEGDLAAFNTEFDLRNPVPLGGSESLQSSMDLMFLRLNYGFSARHGFGLLHYGFDPKDADLKAGPLYFKLRALSGALLMSDNVNRSHEDRESGSISIVSLSMSVIAQLTDSLRLSMGGSLYWLPFKGKVGVSSDSGFFNLAFHNFDQGPIAQIDWEGRIGGWDFFVTDSFYADLASSYTYQETLFEGSSFDEFDTAGIYRYGSGARTRDVSISEYAEQDVSQYINRLDVGLQRLVPGPVRLRVRAHREDLWYNQGNRGRPNVREGISFFAGSERENMRLNPYVRYSLTRNDIEPDWDQYIIAGLHGPITDQLNLNLYAGEFIDGQIDRTRSVAGMHLRHIAGPYTYETLFVGRDINDAFATTETVDHITYNIHQILGPKMFADAFASYQETETVSENPSNRSEFLAGIALTILPGPRTRIRLSYTYDRIDSDSPAFLFSGEDRFDDDERSGDSTYIEQIIRLSLTYRFTDTFFGRLTYQYRDVDAYTIDNSFYENLVILTLTKAL